MNVRAIKTVEFIGGSPGVGTTSWPGSGSPVGMNAIPDRIGKYKVIRQAGRGGFGRVYEAIDPTLSRVVAIKVLKPEGGDLLELSEHEARARANLNQRS